MAGRKRRKSNLLNGRIKVNKRIATGEKKDTEEQQTWSELPTELLETIMSHLTLKENIRASSVCKRWFAIAISVRVVNKSPWIMHFPKSGDMYEFYDPSQRKTYSLKLPQLNESRICHTKDSWLLLYKPKTHLVFFFNPFTQELIELPKFEMTYQILAFSSAPTSSSCVVFTMKHISATVVAISTCHPGAIEWTTVNYQNRLPFVSSIWNKLVFCSGQFYCLSLTGWLGIFDTQGRTWNIHVVRPPKCPSNFFSKNWWKGKFLMEHMGDIFVIYTCCGEKPLVFKLDQANKVWEEMKTLNGVTLFVSFLSSQARIDLLGMMRNSVYFPKVRFYGKRCISYSLDDRRYYPRNQYHDWGEQDPFERIWIEPPEDLSTLF